MSNYRHDENASWKKMNYVAIFPTFFTNSTSLHSKSYDSFHRWSDCNAATAGRCVRGASSTWNQSQQRRHGRRMRMLSTAADVADGPDARRNNDVSVTRQSATTDASWSWLASKSHVRAVAATAAAWKWIGQRRNAQMDSAR